MEAGHEKRQLILAERGQSRSVIEKGPCEVEKQPLIYTGAALGCI